MRLTIHDMKPLVQNHDKLLALWNKAKDRTPKEAKNRVNLRGFVDSFMVADLEKGLKEANGADVVVNINSGGGNAFDGFELFSMLSEYKGKVTTRVTGVAASAAALTYLAGDERLIGPYGMVMLHPASTVAGGFSEDLRKAADLLAKIDTNMADAMERKMDLSDVPDLRAFLLQEEFLNQEESLKLKVATAQTEEEEGEKMEEDEEKEKEMEGDEEETKMEEDEEMTPKEVREYAKKFRNAQARYNMKNLVNHIRGGGR